MISGIGGTSGLDYTYQMQSMQQNNGLSADELFSAIDTNGDGTVIKDEFEKHRAEREGEFKSRMANSQDALSSLISLLKGPVQIGSTNGITNAQDVMSSLMNHLNSSAQTSATGVDAGALNGAPSADKIFSKIDTDGDGSISKAEFEKFHAGKGRGHHHGPPPASESQTDMASLLDPLLTTTNDGAENSTSDQTATNGLTSFIAQALERYFQSAYASGNTTNTDLVNTVG
jgi:hypothetical protein